MSQVPELLTVSQLTKAIKLNLETSFPLINLQGEISNFKIQPSGHLYFSLKDEYAQINAVMFQGQAAQLRVMPKGGDHVIARGELSVYPPKGGYQLIIRELSYVGLGQLLQALELLKIKLHKMGWFKATAKKSLPGFPRCIGVVTSPTGAVIQDILNILSRRFSGFHLILNPVKVQGEGAAKEIAQAIEQFNRHKLVDVIIVGRGGGSLEDLWPFNEEVVAAAIFNSEIPIISAVGHETDHCIADYVADVRAPTPSAAAEIVIAEKSRLLEHLHMIKHRMMQTIRHLIRQNSYRLQGLLKHSIFFKPHAMVESRMQKLDDFQIELNRAMMQQQNLKRQKLENLARQVFALKPINQLHHLKQRLAVLEQTIMQKVGDLFFGYKKEIFTLENLINQKIKEQLFQFRRQLNHLIEMLQVLDPKNLLQKGYSILFAEKSQSVINSVLKLKKGDRAELLLGDGRISITINEVLPCESKSKPS